MRSLYPPISDVSSYRIDVGDGHCVYVEECGNRNGQAAVFLHGGPGSGCNANHRRYFDPLHYRIVLLDQRGSGRSTPLGETRANATDNLVDDLETVRRHLAIEQWVLFGGSWGATLALCYAQAYPRAISAIVLRGPFLARRRDLEWFFGADGAARIFPDSYSTFVADLNRAERDDPVAAYHRAVHGSDRQIALAWANRWRDWSDRVATWTLPPVESAVGSAPATDASVVLAKARIETHYAANRFFLADSVLLENARRLPDVPITIVHGRRDLVCPCEAAWTLHSCIPGSRLVVLPDTGHLLGEPTMVDAMISETDRLKELNRAGTRAN